MVTYTPAEEHESFGGIRRVYRFENNYGASVICHEFSYSSKGGKWELAVLYGDDITYNTPITGDVIGHLNDEQVQELLSKIAAIGETVRVLR
jgi:hypothetical protein